MQADTVNLMGAMTGTHIYFVTEERAGAVLQLALVDRTVQGAWQQVVLGEFVTHRGVIQTPAPASTVEHTIRHAICVRCGSQM